MKINNGTTRTLFPKEIRAKVHAFHQYRFRRFQALSDALDIYFILPTKGWYSVEDILTELEIPKTHASMKRTRRILYALCRSGRVERSIRNAQFTLTFWRRI